MAQGDDPGRVGRFAEARLTVERTLDEAGLNVPARSSCADPVLHVALETDRFLVVATDEDGPVATTLEDRPTVAGLSAAVYDVLVAPDNPEKPRDTATCEAATKAMHVLGFAVEDVNQMSTAPALGR